MKDTIRVIAIVGPTAAGKTEVGISLARKIGGEVISVDSMQIYRWMDIGTAKPDRDTLAEIPHHLIDILDPDQEYNAGLFASDADKIINQLTAVGTTPILVGGTGLYLKALINGIIELPEISAKTRQKVRETASNQGVSEIYRQLKELDPQSAEKLHPNDITRISRALEVVLETGQSIQHFQSQHQFKQQRYQVFYLGTHWSRERLYERINQRTHIMVKAGLVEETQNLLDRGYHRELPSMNSIGYKQAVAFIHGEMDQAEMISDIQQKSRHYAKKQLTWFSKNESIHWLEGNQLKQKDIDRIWKFLES